MSPTREPNVTVNCIHRRAAEWASDLCPQFQTPYLKGKSKGSITVYYCVMCSRILACSFMTLGSSCIGYFSHPSDHIPIKSNLRKERFIWAHRLVEPIMVGEVWWLGHPTLVAGVYGMAYSHLGGWGIRELRPEPEAISPSVSTLYTRWQVPRSHTDTFCPTKDKHKGLWRTFYIYRRAPTEGFACLSLLFHCLAWLWRGASGPHIFK